MLNRRGSDWIDFEMIHYVADKVKILLKMEMKIKMNTRMKTNIKASGWNSVY